MEWLKFEAGAKSIVFVVRRRVLRIFIDSYTHISTERLTLPDMYYIVDVTSVELMNPPN